MKSRTVLCALVACSIVAAATALTRADATRTPFVPVTVTPSTFTEDVVFSPDGKTLFLTRAAADDASQRTIVVLERNGAGWTDPQVLPFSGQWRDLEEVLTPDGQTMIFASNRPVSNGSGAIDGFFGGKLQPGRGGNLWSVRRNVTSWGTPKRLPDAVNAGNSVFSPAITRDGTLYFMRNTLPGPRFHLYVAKLEDGTYRSSAPAPFGDPRYSDFDPAVAPDGSFVIFGSNRPPSPAGGSDLFITFLRNGTWTAPVDMGSSINPNHDAIEPRLSADAKALYFLSQGKLWSADISSWLTQAAADGKAVQFAPKILDDALSPAFFPDETTMLFTQMTDTSATIVQAHLSSGGWSAPVAVSFSGKWKDMDPAIAPDGSYVVFASMRPNGAATGTSLLWRADHTTHGWSEPVMLPRTVNIGPNIFSPSIAADGTIYFLHSTPATHEHQLYRARYRDGRYEQAQPLSFSNPPAKDYDPAIAPDQTFLVFASAGRNAHDTKRHLYAVAACSGAWGPVRPLSYEGDGASDDSSPVIAPDGKAVYFTSATGQTSRVLSMPIPANTTARCDDLTPQR